MLEAETIKQAEMKERVKKRVPQKNDNSSRNQAVLQKSHQKDKHLGIPFNKIFWSILKMDKVGTQAN